LAGQGDPLGKLALMVIIVVIFYDTIFGLVKIGIETITNGFQNFIDQINNMIVLWGGAEPLFPNTEKLLNDLFSWEIFLFTNAMSFAILVFLDLVRSAYKG